MKVLVSARSRFDYNVLRVNNTTNFKTLNKDTEKYCNPMRQNSRMYSEMDELR